jgi:hypothetical protein
MGRRFGELEERNSRCESREKEWKTELKWRSENERNLTTKKRVRSQEGKMKSKEREQTW